MHCRVIVLLIFLTGRIYGQIPEIPLETYEYDTNYIVTYEKLLAIRLVSPRRIYDFRLKNTATDDFLEYRPNLQSAFGVGFTYSWLAFDIVFNPKWNREKNTEVGETNEFNVKATVYLKRHMVDATYRRYKGMHISNPDDYLNPWDGKYPYRPDIRMTNFSVAYTISSNYKKYSPKTTFQLDGRLKKSAGSFLHISEFHLTSLKADSSIMPLEYEQSFNQQAQITRMNIILLQQAIGYAYTFIYKQFYFTLSAMPGVSFSYGAVESDGGNYNPLSFNYLFKSMSGIGINTRKWYAGVYFIYKYQNINLTKELAFNSNLGEWRIFIGYRIHAPHVVKNIMDK